LGIGLLGVVGSMVPLLSDAEESLGLHLLYHLRGPLTPRGDVVVVGIDSQSARALDLPLRASKWPRRHHAQLVDRLADDGAAVIAFDLFFHEPQAGDNDRALAASMQRAGNVLLTQTIDRQTLPLDASSVGNQQVNIERMLSAVPVLADAAMGQAPFPLPKVPIKLNQFWCFKPGSGNAPTMPVVALHMVAGDVFAEFIRLLNAAGAELAGPLFAPADGVFDLHTIIAAIRPLHTLFANDASLAQRALDRLDGYPPGKLSAGDRHAAHPFPGPAVPGGRQPLSEPVRSARQRPDPFLPSPGDRRRYGRTDGGTAEGCRGVRRADGERLDRDP
jgi:adenylate cyclase